MKLARRMEGLKPSETKQFSKLVSELRAEGKRVIDFGHGDTDSPVSDETLAYTFESLKRGLYKYSSSQGNDELLKFLAQKHSVMKENILIGPGAKSLLDMAIRALVDSGTDVALISPFWPTYSSQIVLSGGVQKVFKLEDNFALDKLKFTQFLNTLTPKALLILNNPNNPSGKVLDRETLEFIYNSISSRGMNIISDEVYSDIVFEQTFISILDICDKSLDNVIVINSSSKNYGMSGFRVGYMVSNSYLIQKAIPFVSQTVSNVPEFLQLAYLNEMQNDTHHTMLLNELKKRREIVKENIVKSKNLLLLPTEGSIYVFPMIKPEIPVNTHTFAINLLKDRFVSVLPGSAFNWEGYLRISIGKTNQSEITEGIEILDNYIQEIKT